MAVPKRRTSHSKQGKRRSHDFVTGIKVGYCSNCGEPVLPHRICANCGWYRDKVVEADKEEEK
jgi:large subunit ribosomal protein L32